MIRLQIAGSLAATVLASTYSYANPYKTSGVCDGLPRVVLQTAQGFCIGLVASGLRYPRGVLPLPDGRLIVAEMGNWNARRGALVELVPDGPRFRREVLFENLDRPHGLARGPDGKIYVGEVGSIWRFDPTQPKPSADPLIGRGVTTPGIYSPPTDGRHPLVSLVFDPTGDLYINKGSASDNCEAVLTFPGPRAGRCVESDGESPRGAIVRYSMQWPSASVVSSTVYARGLRNSLAIAVDPRNSRLWQAENGRDNLRAQIPSLKSDEDTPRDELNEIVQGAHYGWPYCYDQNKASPEFPTAQCTSRYRAPALLLPGHAAPLGMTFVTHDKWPASYRGGLAIAFHGYRRNGHRIMFYSFDSGGRPSGTATTLVGGWAATASNPLGAPVDLKFDAHGRLYITEDRNGTVLRLSRTQ
jgi:glucose/arabinose dehydrogenase